MQESDKIKVGFIGFGRMAEGHARQLRETGKFAPAAVCDVTPARAKQAREYGMAATDVLDAFLESDVELVFVTTHSVSHHAMTVAALRAGKNVVVEKPMFAEVRHFKWGDADDFFDIHLRFENGCRATASKCDIAYVSWPKWIVLGTEGSIKHEQETLVRTANRAYFELDGVPPVNLYENYRAHLREGAELLVKSEEGLRVMQVIDAAFESATGGQSVEVNI